MHVAVADALRGERTAAEALADAHRDLQALMQPADATDLATARDAIADAMRDETRYALALEKQVKATNAVLADPGASEADKEQARLDLADAENAVEDAKRQSAAAAKALATLEAPADQAAVATARGRVGDAEAAVAAAKRDTADAQAALSKAESGASSEQIAQARRELAQAEHELSLSTKDAARAAREFTAAQDAGLSQSPSVVAAREALRSAALAGAAAEQGLADAQRNAAVAQRAVGEAQADAARSAAQAAGAASQLNDKMNQLPAPAQAFVRVLAAMKPRLDELRNTAASGFFPGATAGLKAAMGSFTEVNGVVAETSAVLGDAARKSGELVGSPAFGSDIATIGSNNARVIGTLGEALRHVISAVRHVLVAAGPLTQWLAHVANKWALTAAESAKAGRESGKLAAFFERTRAVAERLGSILGHLAHGLFGVGKAGTDTGNKIFASIDRAAARFDEWANSTRGKTQLREFFERTTEIAAALIPVLANASSGFAFLALKVLPVVTLLKLLGPVADEAVIAFVAWKVSITAVNAVIAIHNVLMRVAIGRAIVWRAQLLIAAVSTTAWAAATTVAGAAFWRLNAAMAANPIGLVVVAIAALVAGLIYAYRNSETFRRIVDGALRAVGVAFEWLWDKAKYVVNGDFARDLLAGLGNGLTKVGEVLLSPFKAAWEAVLGFFGVHSPSTLLAELGGNLIAGLVNGLKAGAAALAEVAGWLKDQILNGIRAYIGLYVGVGSWLIRRVVDGVKAVAGAIAEAAGWVKNRVVDGIKAYVTAYAAVGSWVVNRIVDGIKIVGEALASVGGWLRNRVVDLVHAAVAGFTGLGGWILNRVVEGFKVVSEALSGIGGWLKNRIGDALEAGKDGFVGLGKNITDWIVDGLKSGVKAIGKFAKLIIGIIGKIPGLGDIAAKATGAIDTALGELAKGGTYGPRGASQAFAHGGAFARTGGLVSSPITLMGEEAPRHPEYVIPTNPAYRGRAQQLVAQAAGAVGYAEGGVVSAFRGAIDKTNANPKPSLALWMAGIVESGLRNLTYGHADSLGALQLRESLHGRELAMDPFRSALAFLTRGFTGAGGAISLARSDRTAGQVAQAVQGSAFPERYDQVRDQAMRYMGEAGHEGGGPLGAIGDALGAAGDILGDLLSKGAGFLLGKLPGVGDLPPWLKDTGRFVLGKAGDFIKDKVAGLSGSGGGDGGGKPLPSGITDEIKGAIAFSRSIGNWTFGPGQLFRPGGTTYHGQGRAADFGDAGHSAAEMRDLYRAFKGRYGSNIKELFYDPMGEHVKNGSVVGSPFGGHGDHVHLALAQGGKYGQGVLGSYAAGTDYVPRTGMYELHRGEGVTPAATNKAPLEVHVFFDGLPVELQRLVRVEVTRNGEEVAAEYKAGIR